MGSRGSQARWCCVGCGLREKRIGLHRWGWQHREGIRSSGHCTATKRVGRSLNVVRKPAAPVEEPPAEEDPGEGTSSTVRPPPPVQQRGADMVTLDLLAIVPGEPEEIPQQTPLASETQMPGTGPLESPAAVDEDSDSGASTNIDFIPGTQEEEERGVAGPPAQRRRIQIQDGERA
ncbi:uncharacterized protein LOC143822421 [Paroedura picta]|uniref:uncharacterized protein LOC143822421 n=1 Tax=Paroedura picta TaxID=143630 RepID=UPI004057845E